MFSNLIDVQAVRRTLDSVPQAFTRVQLQLFIGSVEMAARRMPVDQLDTISMWTFNALFSQMGPLHPEYRGMVTRKRMISPSTYPSVALEVLRNSGGQ